jgi:hypothetical protein
VSRRTLRFVFLALLLGGLVLWTRLRSPRDLRLEVDLTDALPGEIAEIDVTVLRDGRALARVDERYGPRGAPAKLPVSVRALPGPVQVEVTLVSAGGVARRVSSAIVLQRDAAAVVRAK